MRMTNLRALREARELTREQLAQKAGVHSQTVAAHEYGRANDVSYSIANKLAKALSVDIQELFLPDSTDVRIEAAVSLEPETLSQAQ